MTPSKSVSNSTSLPTVKQLSAPLQPLKPLAAPLKERLKRVKSEGFIEFSENVKARAQNIRQYSQGSSDAHGPHLLRRSMNPWFSRSSSQKLRSNSQKGEWEERFEKRPLMPFTSGVTPFIETPFKKLAVSTTRICSIFLIT